MSSTLYEEIRVLHVDDEPDFTDLTAAFLERESDQFVVESATSAGEGMEKLGEHPPDCVVSDYNMPGIDGLEFLQAVRADNPDLPFILYTGRGSEEVASDAIAADVSDYLQKGSGPEQYELLANRIRNAVKQHRSEKRLRRTRGEYTAVFENAQNALLLVAVEEDRFRYQRCNPQGVELIGRNRAEIVGSSPREVLGPENGTKEVGAYRTCIEQRNTVEYTNTLDLPVGQVNWACEVSPVTENGEIEQLVVAFRDITERRERQQELRRNKRAMDEAPVGITLSDPSQDDNPLVYVNDRFEEVTGYEADEVVGRNCRFLQGDSTREEPVAQIREAIDAEDPVSVELRNYREDGTEFWNHVSIAPIENEDGEVTNYVGFQQNITERKLYEQQLQQQNEPSEEPTSGVSQDLHSP